MRESERERERDIYIYTHVYMYVYVFYIQKAVEGYVTGLLLHFGDSGGLLFVWRSFLSNVCLWGRSCC